ncbi:MAG TPA: signal peptidase I [Verrucomicrobiae bacterium]|nr:signal peptidase I [Verrucomicrobiae bacterium]
MTEVQDTRKSPARSWIQIATVGRNPKATLVRAVIVAAVCVVVFRYLLLPVRVTGISMEPTYHDHSVNFINTLAFLRREPQRGEVVGIRLTPGGEGSSMPHMMYLKRIVGLPGESISFSYGRVIVNGKPLDEPYEKGPCNWNCPPVTLGPTQYFVVGDNRSMSQLNHVFGKVDRSRIVGRVLL